MITPTELVEEMLRLSRLLDVAHTDLVSASKSWAEAEGRYRQARANAYLATSGTVAERAARVDKAVESECFDAHMADALKVAALETVRSMRAQLSACQSVAAALRSEVELAGRHDP